MAAGAATDDGVVGGSVQLSGGAVSVSAAAGADAVKAAVAPSSSAERRATRLAGLWPCWAAGRRAAAAAAAGAQSSRRTISAAMLATNVCGSVRQRAAWDSYVILDVRVRFRPAN